MTRLSARGLIAIAAAASMALFGAISTAEAAKGKGNKGGGGGGGFKVSSHVNKSVKLNSGPKLNYNRKGQSAFGNIRYGEGKSKASKHAKHHYNNNNKHHYNNNKKWHGKYDPYHYRRYNYAWAGLPLYTSYSGCGWIYRNAISTGSHYWWDRYYRCAQYSRY